MTKTLQQLAPSDGVKAIQCSLRCFAFSLASLVPVLGLPMALAAFSNYSKARAIAKGRWNPGGKLLFWGSVLSCIGLVISSVALLMLVAAAFKLLPWQYGNE